MPLLNNPADEAGEQRSFFEETTNTQAEKSEEIFSTNLLLEISNPSQTTQSQMQIPTESREENEDWLLHQQQKASPITLSSFAP